MTDQEFKDEVLGIFQKYAFKTNKTQRMFTIRKNILPTAVGEIINILIKNDGSVYKTSKYSTNRLTFSLYNPLSTLRVHMYSHFIDIADITIIKHYWNETDCPEYRCYFKHYIKDFNEIYEHLSEEQKCWLILKGYDSQWRFK